MVNGRSSSSTLPLKISRDDIMQCGNGGYTRRTHHPSRRVLFSVINLVKFMSDFPHVPVSKSSIANRSCVLGAGINDADYKTGLNIKGNKVRCPYYERWKNVLTRCYSAAHHKISPTYKDCVIADEWLRFSVFRDWMAKQEWVGMELDKDILVPGNKLYSPDTCLFVTQEINALLGNNTASRGKYPQGIYFDNFSGRFKAQISRFGKASHLGRFDTVGEAETAYNIAKAEHIKEVANTQPDKVKAALISISNTMLLAYAAT